jgi:ADP-L-glycero-D-manno-heptose 6-epimerase
VIHKFHGQIAEQGKLELFEGSGDFRRDFVHVDDAVALNLFFFEHPELSGIFNCGTGQAQSFLSLAQLVAGHYDGAEVSEIPFPDDLRGKYQAFTEADLTALRGVGYDAPFLSLAEGVRDYVGILKATQGYHRHPLAPAAASRDSNS